MTRDFAATCDDAQAVINIGRNAPCPCGSGKKYKKCCLAKDEQAAASKRVSASPVWTIEDDGLDDLSNSVVDLIQERRFDEALAACRRLLDEFPDVDDGFERSAMVHAAIGHHALAADFYRKALAFITHPSRADGYDPEIADYYRDEISKQEALAAQR
jgi:tetratricopeptide (TPR) repeat protein